MKNTLSHLKSEIALLNRKNLLRKLVPVEGAASTTLQRDGKELLLFCSNNYLGLANHPEVKATAIAAIQSEGVGAGASRLISGNSFLYQKLERQLAFFKSTESALVFNSGYMANLSGICALAGKGDLILADRLNHASLVDGCRLSGATFRIYRHKDMAQLKKLLTRRRTDQKTLIVTDGIFSMEGDIAPLSELSALAEEYDALIYLDDAHATGVLGPEGRGTCAHFNLSNPRIIQMGTLSKALGGLGGFIAGSDLLVRYLLNKARPFIYTTALPPSILATALIALEWACKGDDLRKQLWKNTDYFRREAVRLGFDVSPSETPIVPLRIGASDKAILFSEKLMAEGIYVPAVRPPTVPAGTSRLRISLMAVHTKEQINHLLLSLKKVGRELRLI